MNNIYETNERTEKYQQIEDRTKMNIISKNYNNNNNKMQQVDSTAGWGEQTKELVYIQRQNNRNFPIWKMKWT